MASNIIARLFRSTKKNAKQRGIEFNLSIDDIKVMFDKSNGRCCMTGIEFDHSPPNGRKRPFTTSIDRIDSEKPYSIENCRLICVAMNLAMNWYGESVFQRIASAYLSKNNDNSYVKVGDLARNRPIGVYPYKLKSGKIKFRVKLKVNSKDVSGGCFDSEEAASLKYHELIRLKKFAPNLPILN